MNVVGFCTLINANSNSSRFIRMEGEIAMRNWKLQCFQYHWPSSWWCRTFDGELVVLLLVLLVVVLLAGAIVDDDDEDIVDAAAAAAEAFTTLAINSCCDWIVCVGDCGFCTPVW